MARKNRRKTTTIRTLAEKEMMEEMKTYRKNGVISVDTQKQEILDTFEWIGKERKSCRMYGDYPISINFIPSKRKDKKSHLSFVIRDGKHKDLTSTGYIQICPHKNRMYFREAESREGYKLYQASNSSPNNRYTKIAIDDNNLKEFVGDYVLKHDDFLELSYIEKEN